MTSSFGGSLTCPCGGEAFTGCCQPILAGAPAATAEALMRSRYTAFVRGDTDHLFRSWHPRSRPELVSTDPNTRWLGLAVLRTEAGGPDDDSGIVEFEACYDAGAGVETLRETSRFTRRAGRWVYLDAIS